MSKNYLLARQPILTKEKEVYGYELLYREEGTKGFPGIKGEVATSSVIISTFMHSKVKDIIHDEFAFINANEEMLLSQNLTILPSNKIIIEILESVEPTKEIFQRCLELKENGFKLALDDFVYEKKWENFGEIIDIVKVDFSITKGDDRDKILYQFENEDLKFLAEKVETHEEFKLAKSIGYDFFQGYFFSKPKIIKSKKIPENKYNYFLIMKEISKEDVEIGVLENIIKTDVSLTYKLLKFINSAFFGLPVKINSIRHAITLLGMQEFRKWVSLVLLGVFGKDKPTELIVMSLVRAKFCELISQTINESEDSDNYFLMGMLSFIDVFLNRSKDKIFEDLTISEKIKKALLDHEGKMSDIIDLIKNLEKFNYERIEEIISNYKLNLEQITDIYLKSVNWANQIKEENIL